jgi:REP element-mobilizing transposase RayT
METASMTTLGYHLTWTTYGTWLPGDERGWYEAGHLGVRDPNPAREELARRLMTEAEIVLTPEQRRLVEATIRDHCARRGWSLHAVNARTNDVHAVVTADRDPGEMMDQLKAWCSRKLSDQAGLTQPVARKAGRRHWFTEGGDKNKLETEEQLQAAIEYVVEKQG